MTIEFAELKDFLSKGLYLKNGDMFITTIEKVIHYKKTWMLRDYML